MPLVRYHPFSHTHHQSHSTRIANHESPSHWPWEGDSHGTYTAMDSNLCEVTPMICA
jgi:hypothetical protein